MAEGTRNNVLHVPAACTVPHRHSGYPSSVAQAIPRTPTQCVGPILIPECCRGSAQGHHPGNGSAEAHGSHCSLVGHHSTHMWLCWVSDSWGQAISPLMSAGTQCSWHWLWGWGPPQGCVPWEKLFLGLTQAAALSWWGLQEGNAASCLRHWGRGEPGGAGGGNPVGTQPLWCGTPLLPLCTTHRPLGAMGPTQSLTKCWEICKACKRENDEAGEILVAPALGTLALPLAKPLPKSLCPELGILIPKECLARLTQPGP